MIPRIPTLALLAAAPLAVLLGCSDGLQSDAETASASGRTIWKPPTPVNVVLILIDTLRADAILDPEGRYDTPNIDALGQDGVLFPKAFSGAPMTLPSHVSLFSSQAPFETKVLGNGQTVPEDLPLVAEWLSDHDYDTRAVISLGTMNPPARQKGVSRGFEEYDYDYWCMSQANDTHERLMASLDERDQEDPLFLFAHFSDPHEPYNSHATEETKVELRMDGELVEELPASDMSLWVRNVELSEGRTVFEFSMPKRRAGRFRVRQFECWEGGKKVDVEWEAVKPMDRVKSAVISVDRGSRPKRECELKIWLNDVPPSDDSRRSRYAEEVAFVDSYIGKLIEKLRSLGLYEDSLILFTSDHGEAMGEKHGSPHPFFGHADGLTDEQIHVPLIVKLPRNDPRHAELAAVSSKVVTNLDVVPTILEIIGVPPLPRQRGTSLFEPHDAVHIAQTQKPEARRDQVGLRDERFKMIYFPEDEKYLLYDVREDPGEQEDVFAERASERPDWPVQLRVLYQQSQGEEHQIDEDQAEMLRALGYGGADDDI